MNIQNALRLIKRMRERKTLEIEMEAEEEVKQGIKLRRDILEKDATIKRSLQKIRTEEKALRARVHKLVGPKESKEIDCYGSTTGEDLYSSGYGAFTKWVEEVYNNRKRRQKTCDLECDRTELLVLKRACTEEDLGDFVKTMEGL